MIIHVIYVMRYINVNVLSHELVFFPYMELLKMLIIQDFLMYQ